MKIAVIDCSVTGHRETYYKTFTHTWASLGHDVLLIAPQPSGTEEAASFQKINTRAFHPLPAGQPLKKKYKVLQNAVIRLKNLAVLRRQLTSFQPDLVYFPCLDDLLPTIAPLRLFDQLMPYPWSGLLVQSMLPPYRTGKPDIRPFLRSRYCKGIGVLNEYSIDSLKPFQPNIQCLPDFADLSVPAASFPLVQTLLKRAGKRKIISLLGSISPRKGIRLLLRTIPLLPENDYFFLMAGKAWLSPAQMKELKTFENSRENCLFAFEQIPNENDFNALVAASDLLFAAYHNFTGSSNLLTKAAAFHKPVIVSEGHCMGRRIHTYGTGIAILQDNADDCSQAIIDLCRGGITSPENFDRYMREHSVEKLTTCLNELISPKI